jgi:hypothetical protein
MLPHLNMLDPEILRDHPEWYCAVRGQLTPEEAVEVQERIAQRFNATWERAHRVLCYPRHWPVHSVPASIRPPMTASQFAARSPAWQARNAAMQIPAGTPRNGRSRSA